MSQRPSEATALSRQLQALMASDRSAEEKVEDALAVGTDYLGVETGLAVKIVEEDATWEAIVSTDPRDAQFPAGTTLDLTETYCRHVSDREASLTVHAETTGGIRDDPARFEHGVETYFGTPLYAGEDVFGTVCFLSGDSHSALETDESLVLELVGRFTQAVLVEAEYETDLGETTELLGVLTRVLRHNIRNKLTIIRGYLDRYAEDANGSANAPLDAVDEILELGEMAREIEEIVRETADRREINVVRTAETVCGTVEDDFPRASITLQAPESLDYYARPTLRLALREVIENAVKHTVGDADARVVITEVDDGVEIAIQDNGSGLPPQERTVLENGSEGRLAHSSGLGLWLAHTIVTNHDGEITTSVTDAGTTMLFTLPRTPTEVKTSLSEGKRYRAYDKFKRLFERAAAVMVLVADDGRILEVNEEAGRVVDRSRDELLGCSIERLLDTDSSRDTLAALLETSSGEVELVASDGTARDVAYSVTRDIVPDQHLLILHDMPNRTRRRHNAND